MNESSNLSILINKNPTYSQKDWSDYYNLILSDDSELDIDYRKREIVSYMKRFAESMDVELKQSQSIYKSAIDTEWFQKNYILVEDDEAYLTKQLSKCNIMVVTANPIEKAVLHYCILKEHANKGIIRIIHDSVVYFLFRWGYYNVVHIHQPQTGGYKDYGLANTVNEALKYVHPNLILSLGVAFGIDHTKQTIGDVLVSQSLFPYSENKIHENYIMPDRSQDKRIDHWLDIRFKNANGFLDGVIYGSILSGGSVISSIQEKERLCSSYSENDYIIGGEMEGCALFQLATTYDIPCAVIKGICDWACVKNDVFTDNTSSNELNRHMDNEFKDSLQAYAMINTFMRTNVLFLDKSLFKVSKTKLLDDEKRVSAIYKNTCICYFVFSIVLVSLNVIMYQNFSIDPVIKYTMYFLVILSCLLIPLIAYYRVKFAKKRIHQEHDLYGKDTLNKKHE